MQTGTETEKINKILAQIQAAIKNYIIIDENDTEWIFEKVANINYQISASSYLRSECPDLIGNTALHIAVIERKSEAFEIFLSHRADYTIKNNNGLTALHLIMQNIANSPSKQHKLKNRFINSVLKAHIKDNNFKNPKNQDELSHFHIACAANNVEAVKGFLQSGIFIDQAVKMESSFCPGFTPLHFATNYYAFEVVHLLLSHGADSHIQNAKGMIPLHMALEMKLKIISDSINLDETVSDTNEKIVQLLLNKENNGDLVILDNSGLSNFHVSCALNDRKIAECILQKVVNINHTVNMNSPLWPGFTALHFAALCNIDTVKLLTLNGADINIKDAKGVTALDICMKNYEIEDISMIISFYTTWRNIMLSDGKTKLLDLVVAMSNSDKLDNFLNKFSQNISISSDSPLWPGCSPMHLAVMFKKTNITILDNLCRQNSSMLLHQDIHGRTPIHLAFSLNKIPAMNLMLQFLEEHSNLMDSVDKDGLSFVHIASAHNQTTLLERLLSIGANVNITYKGYLQEYPTKICSNLTPLHFAVMNASVDAVSILIKNSADVYAKEANDMTPIHFLSRNNIGIGQIVDILLSTPNLKNSVVNGIGLSHLFIACLFEKPEAIKQLLDNGADVNARITSRYSYKATSLLELCVCQLRSSLFIVQLLLERGADIFTKSSKGFALFYVLLEAGGHFMREFMKILKSNEALMARVKMESGMTSLHLACFDRDINLIEKSLNERENVNVQIPPFSPILQGYTPLHIFMHSSLDHYAYDDDVMKIILLLLKAGADVTLQSAKLETVIHMAYWLFIDDLSQADEESYQLLNTLLEAQQDFSINPTNAEGISHFHMACYLCNERIVKKLLKHGDIDINRQIDYFSSRLAGSSALQLAASSIQRFCGISRQLKMVDMLLNYGAEINTEDNYGDTPFHHCMRRNSVDLFERLARNGGDVNARNISGETPLYCYFKSNEVSPEGIKNLMRFGCRLNTFSAVTHKGYLSKAVGNFRYTEIEELFSVLSVNFKPELQVDNVGRTVIHNIVSNEVSTIYAFEYADLTEQLSRVGCDIDDQDNMGRTALHLAAKFYNCEAIFGLLSAGADINIVDNNGKTALADVFDGCEECDDRDDEDGTDCVHLEALEILAIHVKKLQLCGLEVNKQNEDLANEAFEKLQKETDDLIDHCLKKIKILKKTNIGSHSLTLYDFLSEYGAVVDYPRMSQIKRYDVQKFFTVDREIFRKKFYQFSGILQLQYRKARVRSKLVKLAKDALTDLIGLRLPEICSELILIFLKNSELKTLIESVNCTENAK